MREKDGDMAEQPEPKSLWRRVREHPVLAGIVGLFVVAAALVAFLNQLPDLFDKTLPWLGGHLSIGGFSFSVQQALAALVMAGGLLLLGWIAWQTRPSVQKRAVDALVTWVYRRKYWDDGLSDQAKTTEGAPEFYGQEVYRYLGIGGSYKRSPTVAGEPGYAGPPKVRVVVPPPQIVGRIEDEPSHQPATHADPSSLASQVPYRPTPRADVHRLPPGIVEKPEEYRAADIEGFCTQRAALQRAGETLYVDLYGVSINTERKEDLAWQTRMRPWLEACAQHHARFWSEKFDPRLRRRTQPTIPTWRGQHQDTIQKRLQWLQEYGWGCDE